MAPNSHRVKRFLTPVNTICADSAARKSPVIFDITKSPCFAIIFSIKLEL